MRESGEEEQIVIEVAGGRLKQIQQKGSRFLRDVLGILRILSAAIRNVRLGNIKAQVESAYPSCRGYLEDVWAQIRHHVHTAKKEAVQQEDLESETNLEAKVPAYGVSGPYKKFMFPLHLVYRRREGGFALSLAFVLIVLNGIFGFSLFWTLLIWLIQDGIAAYRIAKGVIFKVFEYHFHGKTEPQFLLHPESETLGWLNVLIKSVWRHSFRGIARRDLVDIINAKLEQRRGDLTEEDKINRKNRWGFWRFEPRIVKLDVGEIAPWISGIKSFKNKIILLQSTQSNILLEVGIVCPLRPDIVIKLNEHFSFGITELKFNALFRLKFSPLLRDEKVFGECHVSMVNAPVIDFDLTGFLGFLAHPPLKNILIFCLQQFLKYAVTPRKLNVPNPHIKNITEHTMYSTRPEGILRVHLKSGRSVKMKSKPLICVCLRRPDPYCILTLGARAIKSKVQLKTTSPVWNLVHDFPITSSDILWGEIKVELVDWDWALWQSDQHLGFTTLNVGKLVAKREYDEWYYVAKAGSTQLALQTTFYPVVGGTQDTAGEGPSRLLPRYTGGAVLVILLYGVKVTRRCRPMVAIEISGKETYASSFGNYSNNWEFAEEFLFPIENTGSDKVTLKLFDYNARTSITKVTRSVLMTVMKVMGDFKEQKRGGIRPFNDSQHSLLGQKTLDLDKFSGHKQTIQLDSNESGYYYLQVQGKLYPVDL